MPAAYEDMVACTLEDICLAHGVTLPQGASPNHRKPLSVTCCDRPLHDLFMRAQDIDLFIDSFGIEPSTKEEVQRVGQYYQFKSIALRHQLLSYEPPSNIQAVLADALASYLFTNFTFINPQRNPVRLLATRLSSRLSSAVVSFYEEYEPELLLWVGMVGAYSSYKQSDYLRFLKIVGATASRLQLASWDECYERLRKVLFCKDSVVVNRFKSIWLAATIRGELLEV